MFFGIFKTVKKAIKEVRDLIKKDANRFKEEIFQLDGFKLNKPTYDLKTEELEEGFCFFGSEVYNNLSINKCIKLLRKSDSIK